jgi:chromate transporter
MRPEGEIAASGKAQRSGTAREVFATFLKLGFTSFGGPIAHLGYFHRELVAKRGWASEAQYGQLLALCQFLPGPSSSQLGFALGLIRAGWLGALAAFVAFTLPSALLLFAFASAADYLSGAYGQAASHGLKLVAVAVVADGVRRMARQLTPDAPRALMAACAAAIVVTTQWPLIQLAVIAAGAVAGQRLCRRLPKVEGASFSLSYGPRLGACLLVVFSVLLVIALALSESRSGSMLANASAGFYRAGALVFGGGHVVLPLLKQTVVVPGWLTTDEFLAGYGAAQAAPGPMFTLAAFLGARLDGAVGGALGASVCLLAIMLPGLLLVAGSLPLWSAIGRRPHATRALAGVNAAVVGLLVAALYDPVWTSAVQDAADFATALIAFVLLAATRTSTLWIVMWCIVASIARVSVA